MSRHGECRVDVSRAAAHVYLKSSRLVVWLMGICRSSGVGERATDDCMRSFPALAG